MVCSFRWNSGARSFPRPGTAWRAIWPPGLIKGIGPATAAQIVSRFGVETLDILQNHPERLLEVKGITENKLEDIKTSYAESRMLQDLMTLLSPFKITPKTALKIYQHFGPASVDILKKSPFELCQVSGFGFLRVDAIVQKNGGDLHDPIAGQRLHCSGRWRTARAAKDICSCLVKLCGRRLFGFSTQKSPSRLSGFMNRRSRMCFRT